MKSICLPALLGIVATLSSHADTATNRVESLAQFPLLEFKRDSNFIAIRHSLPAVGAVHPFDDRPTVGFRLTTPEWLDGPVEWIVLGDSPLDGEWTLHDAGAGIVARAIARPAGDGAIRASIEAAQLAGGATYTLVRPLADGETGPDAVAITVASARGKYLFGDLVRNYHMPDPVRPQREVMEKILQIREEQGNGPAVEYFSQELDKRQHLEMAFDGLFRAAWSDAQRGTGRDDREWAAAIYHTIFMRGWAHRYYFLSLGVFSNLTTTYLELNRHGQVAELLEWWQDAQRLGGYVMDPTSYPDRGPALEFLPEVRRREIPALAPFSMADFSDGAPRTINPEFRSYSAAGFITYAGHLHRAGQWRDAMEWLCWIIELSEQRHEAKAEGAGNNWHNARIGLINALSDMELHEQVLQLSEHGLASSIRDGYRNRSMLRYEHMKYAAMLDLGRSSADIVRSLGELVTKVKENRELSLTVRHHVEVTLAQAMIAHGQVGDGESLLDQLVGDGDSKAGLARVAHWLRIGRVAGVENELIDLLHRCREAGNKISEIRLYGMYADFLESEGRLEEALTIRREAVRLCVSFDFFAFHPGELAKLAVLLDRLGNPAEAITAADEARRLLADPRLPGHLAGDARATLAGFSPRPRDAEDTTVGPPVDFQPVRSVVIPIDGMPWSTHLTLANPSTRATTGILRARSANVLFSENEDSLAITAQLNENHGADGEIHLRIDAGTYRLLTLHAAADTQYEGEIEMEWTADHDATTATTTVQIEAPDSGVSGSLIQAGEFRNNPYYGIPILHTYVSGDSSATSFPVRFTTSAPARVEVYDIHGSPLCIDAQGNGSLRDTGDELFGASDRHGNLAMPLTDGRAAFMVILYPHAPLPDDGLLVDVEIFDGEVWSIHAQNRLMP